MFVSAYTKRRLTILIGLFLTVSCTQYKPQSSLSDKNLELKNLVLSGCSGKKVVYSVVDGSSMTWILETINKDGSGGQLKSTHRTTGALGTIQGQLNDSKAAVMFNMQDLATGDVTRDRILRDQLFTENGTESFRLILDQIDTHETGVGVGNVKKLKMVARLEIGGRIARLIFDAVVSEKGGIYYAENEKLAIGTRADNAKINAISLDDKLEKLSTALGIKFANIMELKMKLLLKKDCH